MIAVLFAGADGWAEGMRALEPDLHDEMVGLELDRWATTLTARAAGHRTIRADVEAWPLGPLGSLDGLIASPPCQAFSTAGRAEGRSFVDELLESARRGHTLPEAPAKVRLVLEATRWVRAGRPRWVALEQVPAVLPIWRAYCSWLDGLGYSTWCGVLDAADYGAPQNRKRAILVASLDLPVGCPTPTHAENPTDSLFGPALAPWVSGGAGLGWEPPAEIVTNQVTDCAKGGYYRRSVDRPSVTQHTARNWFWERPATTVVGSFRPEVIAAPGWRGPGDGPRQNAPGSVSVSVSEALVLQTFRPDYPVQGPKTSVGLQIGNAVPPRLAAHVLGAALGLTVALPTADRLAAAGPVPCGTGA